MLQQAELREPGNGMLWYVEAMLEHQAGHLDTATALLHEAASRPNWDDHRREARDALLHVALDEWGVSKEELAGGAIGIPLRELGLAFQAATPSPSPCWIGDLLADASTQGSVKSWAVASAFLDLQNVQWADADYRTNPFVRTWFGCALCPCSPFAVRLGGSPGTYCPGGWPSESAWTPHLRRVLTMTLSGKTARRMASIESSHCNAGAEHRAWYLAHFGSWLERMFPGSELWRVQRPLEELHLLVSVLAFGLFLAGLPFGWFAQLGRRRALRQPGYWLTLSLCTSLPLVWLYSRTESGGLLAFSGMAMLAVLALQIGGRSWRIRPFSLGIVAASAAGVMAVVVGFLRTQI